MLTKIDWISLTIKEPALIQEDAETGAIGSRAGQFDLRTTALLNLLSTLPRWQRAPGRKPFKDVFRDKNHNVSVYSGKAFNFTLIEFSGGGCELLRSLSALDQLIVEFQDRITRIDIACDMETKVTPLDFAEAREPGRFKAQSFVDSQHGSTYYVGSKTSDRYARVYRYNEGHPRSHLLRCEFSLRDKEAKSVVSEIVATDVETVARRLGKTFGWLHPVWKEENEDAEKLSAAPREERQGSTVFWLMKQVIPALQRLYEEGHRDDLTEFAKRATLIASGNYED